MFPRRVQPHPRGAGGAADLLCTHPMFGPESGRHGWRDLPFVYEKVPPPPLMLRRILETEETAWNASACLFASVFPVRSPYPLA